MQNQVPKNWQKVKLNDLGFVGRGKSKHRPRNDSSLYGGEYPFIQTSDVKNANLYIADYSQTYNNKGLSQSKLWDPGTLLITIAANIAETAILKIPACFPDSIVGFIADPKKSDTRFVKYYIDIIKLNMQSASKGTTQDNLSLDKLLTFAFFVPEDVVVQQKIASILSAYDDLIENNNKRIKILEEMAQAIYKEWFALPSVALAKEGKLPEGWEIKKVKDFGLVVTGKTPSKQKSEYYGNYMPFIKTPDMHGNIFCIKTGESLSEAGTNSQKNKILPANSICVSCIGTAGIVTITTQASQTNQQINSVVLKDQIDKEFLFFALRGLENTINMYGANGATMVNLNKSKFESLQIIYPSADLVNSFHTIVYPMFELIKNLQFKNHSLYQTRDLLLPKLMRGEIRIQ